MGFFYLISPAAWLRIAIISLILACGSAFVLFGNRLPAISWDPVPATSSFGTGSAPPLAEQMHAIAPKGILDPRAQFNAAQAFDDAPIKPAYFLPPAVAPIGILDPQWNGVGL